MKIITKKFQLGSNPPNRCDVHEHKRVNIRDGVINLLFLAFVLLTILSVAFSYIYTLSTVYGPSMQPTLNETGRDNSDTVYINRESEIRHSDIIVIEKETYYVIKRVIALPGDTVDIIEDENWDGVNENLRYRVMLNGELLDESSYLNFALDTTNLDDHYSSFSAYKTLHISRVNPDGSITIGANEIFIMGDNRKNSEDSSVNGPYDLSKMLGRVEIIIKYNTGVLEHYNQKIIGMIKAFLVNTF